MKQTDTKEALTNQAYEQAYKTLIASGISDLYFLNGTEKLGGPVDTDFEAQVHDTGSDQL